MICTNEISLRLTSKFILTREIVFVYKESINYEIIYSIIQNTISLSGCLHKTAYFYIWHLLIYNLSE